MMMLNLAETILIIYHSRQRFDFYQVDNSSVLTLVGVVVPVKNIVNVCINPVALTLTCEEILLNPPNETIFITVPFTVILVQ